MSSQRSVPGKRHSNTGRVNGILFQHSIILFCLILFLYCPVYQHFILFYGFRVMLRKAFCIRAFKKYPTMFSGSAIALIPPRFYFGFWQDAENLIISS